MRKWLLFVVIALAAAGVVVAVLPFGRPLPRGSFTYRSHSSPSDCAPPIVSAWRDDPADSGWFGYAPLTSTPFSAPATCREVGRHRLAAAALLEVPVLVALVVLFLPRRRFDRPTNPRTNLAT